MKLESFENPKIKKAKATEGENEKKREKLGKLGSKQNRLKKKHVSWLQGKTVTEDSKGRVSKEQGEDSSSVVNERIWIGHFYLSFNQAVNLGRPIQHESLNILQNSHLSISCSLQTNGIRGFVFQNDSERVEKKI